MPIMFKVGKVVYRRGLFAVSLNELLEVARVRV